MPTFSATARGYKNLWDKCELVKDSESSTVAKKIISLRDRYEAVAETVESPNIWPLVGALHYREAGLSFAGVLHNGERIIGTGRRTSLVPSGRGPFSTWEEAAVDALKIKNWQSIEEWTIARWLYEAERYNGFGYFSRGINSPYVWSGTNLQQHGKYVSDGKFSSSAWDSQLGIAAVLKAVFSADPSLEPGHGEPGPVPEFNADELAKELILAITPILERTIKMAAATEGTKSIFQSKTVWGAVIAALPTLIVNLGPALGIPITEDLATQVVQTLVTLAGTVIAIYGRVSATKSIA